MTRILIADPDFHTRQALALLIERKLGMSAVSGAGDRASLERQLAAGEPDLLLLDCYLPDLSAAEMARLARRSNGMRLVLLSVNPDDAAAAATFGAAFIYKGALPEEVLATLRAVVSAHDIQFTQHLSLPHQTLA